MNKKYAIIVGSITAAVLIVVGVVFYFVSTQSENDEDNNNDIVTTQNESVQDEDNNNADTSNSDNESNESDDNSDNQDNDTTTAVDDTNELANASGLAAWIVDGKNIKVSNGSVTRMVELKTDCTYLYTVQVVDKNYIAVGCSISKNNEWTEYKIIGVEISNNLEMQDEKVLDVIAHDSFNGIDDFIVSNISMYSRTKWAVRINDFTNGSSSYVILVGRKEEDSVEYFSRSDGFSECGIGDCGMGCTNLMANSTIAWSEDGNKIAYIGGVVRFNTWFVVQDVNTGDIIYDIKFASEDDENVIKAYNWISNSKIVVVKGGNNIKILDVYAGNYQKVTALDEQYHVQNISYNSELNKVLIDVWNEATASVIVLNLNDKNISIWKEDTTNALWMGNNIVYVKTYNPSECDACVICRDYCIDSINISISGKDNETKELDNSVGESCGELPGLEHLTSIDAI